MRAQGHVRAYEYSFLTDCFQQWAASETLWSKGINGYVPQTRLTANPEIRNAPGIHHTVKCTRVLRSAPSAAKNFVATSIPRSLVYPILAICTLI